MSSQSSSNNSSFAEVVRSVSVKTVKIVRVCKVERFSPNKANVIRSTISSTPAFKRKRAELSSFSPILSPDRIQKVKNDVIDSQSLRFTVRKRRTNTLTKQRRIAASNKSIKLVSSSVQTDNEENALIEKYIEEVRALNENKRQIAFCLQVEKEKNSVLRSTLGSILERSEIAIDDTFIQSFNLERSISATKNPDLSTDVKVSEYHAEINRAVKIKSQIHNGLMGTMKSIKKDCKGAFEDVIQRHKEASKAFPSQSSSKRNISSSSKNSILTKSLKVSKRVPFNPDVKFLQAPKSVQFRIPLDEFLAVSQDESPNLSVNISSDKIEVEIPKLNSPVNVIVKREQVTTKISEPFEVPENVNLSLLEISQENDWENFASTSHRVMHRVNDDDAGSLLDYDSSPSSSSQPVLIKQEAVSSESMSDN